MNLPHLNLELTLHQQFQLRTIQDAIARATSQELADLCLELLARQSMVKDNAVRSLLNPAVNTVTIGAKEFAEFSCQRQIEIIETMIPDLRIEREGDYFVSNGSLFTMKRYDTPLELLADLTRSLLGSKEYHAGLGDK